MNGFHVHLHDIHSCIGVPFGWFSYIPYTHTHLRKPDPWGGVGFRLSHDTIGIFPDGGSDQDLWTSGRILRQPHNIRS